MINRRRECSYWGIPSRFTEGLGHKLELLLQNVFPQLECGRKLGSLVGILRRSGQSKLNQHGSIMIYLVPNYCELNELSESKEFSTRPYFPCTINYSWCLYESVARSVAKENSSPVVAERPRVDPVSLELISKTSLRPELTSDALQRESKLYSLLRWKHWHVLE